MVYRAATLLIFATSVCMSACSPASEPEITAAFTSRMQAVDEARTSVENRVKRLAADCQQGLVSSLVSVSEATSASVSQPRLRSRRRDPDSADSLAGLTGARRSGSALGL